MTGARPPVASRPIPISPVEVEAGVIPAMVERLIRDVDPVEVILFGSYARGEATRGSDVDLLVVLDDDSREKRGAIYEALRTPGTPNDGVATTPARLARQAHLRGLLYRTALREGRLLYRRPGVDAPWWEAAREGTMTPEETTTETHRWLGQARDDLTGAERLMAPPSLPGSVCFHAQQAAEKALKAALIWQGDEPPRTHSLDELRNALSPGLGVKSNFPDLQWLSEWAVKGRYPGADVSDVDARKAIVQARAIYQQVAADLRAGGLETPG